MKNFLGLFLILGLNHIGFANTTFERTTEGSKTIVKFTFGSTIIKSASYNTMADVINFINDNVSSIAGPIRVDGYVDPVGEAPYNQILSERRTHAVVRYMKENGVQSQDFQVTAYGETTSFGSSLDNRHVEVTGLSVFATQNNFSIQSVSDFVHKRRECKVSTIDKSLKPFGLEIKLDIEKVA